MNRTQTSLIPLPVFSFSEMVLRTQGPIGHPLAQKVTSKRTAKKRKGGAGSRAREVVKGRWYCTAKGMEQVLRERGLFVPGMDQWISGSVVEGAPMP
jgi:hypothetical protein